MTHAPGALLGGSASAPADAVVQTPPKGATPAKGPSKSQPPPKPQEPAGLKTIGGDIVCRQFPDLIISYGHGEKAVNSQRNQLTPKCWTLPDIAGAPQDSDWIGVAVENEQCFVSVLDIEDGKNFRATLPHCDKRSKHYVGTLKSDYYDKAYCYAAPDLGSLSFPLSSEVSPLPKDTLFDALCYQNGGSVGESNDV